jgi:hypothetical protein
MTANIKGNPPGFAGRQAAIVADNINALAQGKTDLAEYQSVASPSQCPSDSPAEPVSSPDKTRSSGPRPSPS